MPSMPLPTIVRPLAGTDFSANNIGFVDVEPSIALPTTNLEAYFRLKISSDYALTNKVAGKSSASVAGTPTIGPTYGPKSVDIASGALIMPAAFQPPYTIISVFHQLATVATGQTLGGNPNTSSTSGLRAGLTTDTSNRIRAQAKNGSDAAVVAFLAAAGGERDEFVAAVFDTTNNIIKMRRSRTNEEATSAYTTWGTVSGAHRVLGDTPSAGNSPGEIAGYLHIVYSRALSSAEIDAIYALAQSSLAVGGITI